MSANSEHLFDATEFRRALSLFPTGVAIITTLSPQGQPVGLTCNSFNSVSLHPPLVSWGLRQESRAVEAFRTGGGFAINILSGDQQHLSARFASRAIADKFEDVSYSAGLNGMPLLDNCAATFECSTFAIHEAGDHLLFLGEVQRFNHELSQHPLVFCKGAYMLLTQALQNPNSQTPARAAEIAEARRVFHGALLRLACLNGQSSDFDALEKNLAQIEYSSQIGDAKHRAEAGVEFFRLIGKATHNEVVGALADALADIMRRELRDGGGITPRPELVPVRRNIVHSLRARDAHTAERELTRYMDLVSVKQPMPVLARSA